jgi:alanyl-tRNA synthetase
MKKFFSGSEIRQTFIDYFKKHRHTYVPSSSIVPGGDQTLLFTNAGMVQFKDVFLGTDIRPYTRAVNSQKCMRVAGKHNDLDDVGRDDSHHTFFEMLGNWSFGDYYKKEAITWAWELLTDVWGLDKTKLWATCFKDDKGNIPSDDEAARYWKQQPGINPEQVLYFGRKENFWEMAETGPCGPCSEIHIDLGAEYCNKQGQLNHVCRVNGDCKRYLELWNLVFMQYNRLSPTTLDALPATHVDTGMGFERIVAVIQGVYSNYKTDLFSPLMDVVQELTGNTPQERENNLTPYRVIADHARAASFLMADGIVPGNTGRNYVCRMIIRRAARFGSKIGLNDPFLAKVAGKVIEGYGEAYPELVKNSKIILDNLTREEERFRKTVEEGVSRLDEMINNLKATKQTLINGDQVFDLYATHGLPLEITRDIVREQGFDVDEAGFQLAMDEHRIASGSGKAFGTMGGEDVDIYRTIFEGLQKEGKLTSAGVVYDPYSKTTNETELLAIIKDGISVKTASIGDDIEVVLSHCNFYIESGGQVGDTGIITKNDGVDWKIKIDSTRKPAAGLIVLSGKVVSGSPQVFDRVVSEVDIQRRFDIMRNHTATHLLHAELQKVLGPHARQAGSLVADDHLRFDFTHTDALSQEELEQIESGVNNAIYNNYPLKIVTKPLSDAMAEGATALFGEKYGEIVRTITIGDKTQVSYELCGGTHVNETGVIGICIITSEGSAAAGVRRIEAATGRKAYDLIQKRLRMIKLTAHMLNSPLDETPSRVQMVMDELDLAKKQSQKLRQELVVSEFDLSLKKTVFIKDIPVLSVLLSDANADILRQMADRFRQNYANGVVVLGSSVDGRPVIIAAVAESLVKKGIHAGELVKTIARIVGGSGGGRPTLAQAGGNDASLLPNALDEVVPTIWKYLGE